MPELLDGVWYLVEGDKVNGTMSLGTVGPDGKSCFVNFEDGDMEYTDPDTYEEYQVDVQRFGGPDFQHFGRLCLAEDADLISETLDDFVLSGGVLSTPRPGWNPAVVKKYTPLLDRFTLAEFAQFVDEEDNNGHSGQTVLGRFMDRVAADIASGIYSGEPFDALVDTAQEWCALPARTRESYVLVIYNRYK